MNRLGSFILEKMMLTKLKKAIGIVTVSVFHQKNYSSELSSFSINLSFYSKMDHVKFVEDSL